MVAGCCWTVFRLLLVSPMDEHVAWRMVVCHNHAFRYNPSLGDTFSEGWTEFHKKKSHHLNGAAAYTSEAHRSGNPCKGLLTRVFGVLAATSLHFYPLEANPVLAIPAFLPCASRCTVSLVV